MPFVAPEARDVRCPVAPMWRSPAIPSRPFARIGRRVTVFVRHARLLWLAADAVALDEHRRFLHQRIMAKSAFTHGYQRRAEELAKCP